MMLLCGCMNLTDHAKPLPPPSGDPRIAIEVPETVEDITCRTVGTTQLVALDTPPPDTAMLVEHEYQNVVWYRGADGEIVLEESDDWSTFQHIYRKLRTGWYECGTLAWTSTP